jgi:HEAT repeat protein
MSLSKHSRFVFVLVGLLMLSAQASRGGDPAEFHAILKSDVNVHEKQVACRQLALVGNAESVAILVDLLSDEKLAHAARFALEVIPDPAVDAALRNSLDKLEGLQLVGAINSIGVRRDTEAVDQLTAMLDDSNKEIVSAAEAALGNIANKAAVATLLKRLGKEGIDSNSTADACMAAGDMLLANNQQSEAVEVYDAVRKADTPRHLQIAATWSAIRARGNDALPLFEELLAGEDDELFSVALQAARSEIADAAVEPLVDALDAANADRKALIITTLGDLGDTAALPKITPYLHSDSSVLQLAAIGALKQLGDGSVVDPLLKAASQDNETAAEAARDALKGMTGDGVDLVLTDKLKADSSDKLLISLAGSRRIAAAIPTLWSAAESEDKSVRHAAIRALGENIGPDEINRLMAKAVAAGDDEEQQATIEALTKASLRAPDREAVVEQLSAQFSQTPPESRKVLFELLRVIGGETALKIIVAGAQDSSDVVQDASTQALGKWLTADVAPELLTLAKSFKNPKYRVRSMRAYIRVIQQFGLPPDQRLAMAQEALKAAERDDERILTIKALLQFPNPDSLSLTTDQLSNPALRDTAAQTALDMIDQINDKVALRTAMQKVATSGANPALVKQAEDVLSRLAS